MINYEFINMGAYISEPVKGKICLDVGNNLQKGIIDHHHMEKKTCAAKLILQHKDFLSKWIKIKSKNYTMILHRAPDMDCISSAYLAAKYIKDGKY